MPIEAPTTEAMQIDDHADEPNQPVDTDRLGTLPPPPPAHAPVGKPLGSRYLLEREIGSGATGRVWQGRRRDDQTPVAVKLLRREFAQDPEAVARFVRQRTALLAPDHPHLVKVYDLVAEGEVLAVVMDLVDGEDLRRLARRRVLRPSHALTVLEQVASALAALHAAGVVHRDVKPENVLVRWRDGDPHALLTDFGLVGLATGPTDLTRQSQLLGTPAYVAPEIVKGRPAVTASDVYGLGVLAYELLAGERPYQAPDPIALLYAHVEAEPERPPHLAEPLWRLVHAMLAKEPAARPTAAAVAADFAALASADPLPPPVPPAPPIPHQGDPAPSSPPAPVRSGSASGFAAEVSAEPGGAPVAEPEQATGLPTTAATRPAPEPPEPPPPRRRRGLLVTATGLVAVLGVAAGIYLGQQQEPPPRPPAETPGPRPAIYYLHVTATSPEPGQVLLRWDPILDSVDGYGTYAIFRDERIPVEDGRDLEQPFLVPGVDEQTKYCWQVRAVIFSLEPVPRPYESPSAEKLACLTANGEQS